MQNLREFYRARLTPGLLLTAFLVAYAAAAAAFQFISKIPPWVDGSPVDIMTGSMIWMCCLVAILMSLLTTVRFWQSLMWLAGAASLGVVALDELFAMHEHAAKIRDDDDPKLIMALAAAVGVAVLAKVQRLSGTKLWLIVGGFSVHMLYLLSDLGDGDFFDITFGNPDRLRVLEEGLEFGAMALYLAAFVLILLATIAERTIVRVMPAE